MSYQFTDTELQDFIEAWEGDFGERLSVEKARSEMERVLTFFSLLGQALKKPAE